MQILDVVQEDLRPRLQQHVSVDFREPELLSFVPERKCILRKPHVVTDQKILPQLTQGDLVVDLVVVKADPCDISESARTQRKKVEDNEQAAQNSSQIHFAMRG